MSGTLITQNLKGPASGSNANKIIVPTGHKLSLNGETKTEWGLSIKQKVQSLQTSYVTVNTTTPTTVMSVSITVSEGSTVFVTAQGEQNNSDTGEAWQWHQLYRDSTAIGTSAISVCRGAWNEEFHHSFWDENLSAGTYTYSFKAWNGDPYMQYGEHSDPMIQCVEFGV